MSQRELVVFVFASAALALPGCSSAIRKPRLESPGPANVQRYNATQFDPYPLPDMGPEIVGGRPPDYAVPVPEVVRANQFRNAQAALGSPIFVPQQPALPPAYPPSGVPSYPPGGMPTYPTGVPTYPPSGVPTYPPAMPSTPSVEYRY